MNESNKQTLNRKILGWVGYILLIGVVLYFFAPASWWQFGVKDIEERSKNGDFSLRLLNDNEGGKWSFDDQRGKVVVINYWAT